MRLRVQPGWTSAMNSRFNGSAVFLLALALLACGGAAAGAARYEVATYDSPSGFGFNAELNGTLDGQANKDGTACFFVPGTDASKTILSWPLGYSARADPLRVVNESGHSVVTVGQQIKLRGGLSPDSSSSTRGCPNGKPVWLVAEVTVAK